MCAKRFGSKFLETGQVLKDGEPVKDSHNLLQWGRRVPLGDLLRSPLGGLLLSIAGFKRRHY